MKSYDKQYSAESDLFGQPYPEFKDFLDQHAKVGGKALDLGCGQGRDAILLAQAGYQVTAVDSSSVGINQLVERAKNQNLSIDGVVADLFTYQFTDCYDAIVLDSILHFGKADKTKEVTLLDRLARHLCANGYLFIFIHRSVAKEKTLRRWHNQYSKELSLAHSGYIDYIYKENATNFSSQFQMYAAFYQRNLFPNDYLRKS